MADYRLNFSLNAIDYDLYPPGSFDLLRGSADPSTISYQSVPVIRIFGRTDAGQNVTALIHNVYPYFYIDYDGSLIEIEMQSKCANLLRSVNLALVGAYRKNPYDDANTFVADVSVCRATPFYGFHSGWKLFYKISLLNPKHISRLADLFRQGLVLRESHQPYEAHLPYLLQFMIDYNLYGCGPVEVRSVSFRLPLPAKDNTMPSYSITARSTNSDGTFLDIPQPAYLETVPPELLRDDFPRLSRSAIEIDVGSENIVNRTKVKQRILHDSPASERMNDGRELRLLHSLSELWKSEEHRRQKMGIDISSQSKASYGQRDARPRWRNHDQLWERLNEIREFCSPEVDNTSLEATSPIPTSFESVNNSALRGQDLSVARRARKSDIPANQIVYNAREESSDKHSTEHSRKSEYLRLFLRDSLVYNIRGPCSLGPTENRFVPTLPKNALQRTVVLGRRSPRMMLPVVRLRGGAFGSGCLPNSKKARNEAQSHYFDISILKKYTYYSLPPSKRQLASTISNMHVSYYLEPAYCGSETVRRQK